MKKNMRKKGFSLVELLVTMAIIAVLLGLVGFGIATAQRNSRDSQRRQKVSDIRLGLEDYLTRHNKYPSQDNPNEFLLSKNQVVLDPNSNNPITILFKGPTEAGNPPDSKPTATVYCYTLASTDGGYLLSAKLENGEWFDSSSTLSGSQKCTTGLTVQ